MTPEERSPYVLTAHDTSGDLKKSYVECDRVFVEGYAAGLHIQNPDWWIRINGRTLYGPGEKQWRTQPVC
jgi:hypothetical protein